MTDLDKQLRELTVEIICDYCKTSYQVRLTGFGGAYICECGVAIKTTHSKQISISRSQKKTIDL